MITDIILVICVIGLTFSLYMLVRNRQVFNERKKTHATIFKKDKDGNYINNNQIFSLCGEMDSISTYDKMFYHFWKRPTSFYKDFLTKLEASNKEKLRERNE